jgi:hypothetical protein
MVSCTECGVSNVAASFYDLSAIFSLRDHFASLDPAGKPQAVVAVPAAAARAAFPEVGAIRFIVGFDKARQIFDPRYYADRDVALRTLFGAIELLVAPRAGAGGDELGALLDRTVRALPFDPVFAGASSTVVREALRDGRPVDHLVPPETLAFVGELAPYALPTDDATAPDRYALREALIAALGTDRGWAERNADLRALVARVAAPTADGAALRAWLAAAPGGRVPPTLREWLAIGDA